MHRGSLGAFALALAMVVAACAVDEAEHLRGGAGDGEAAAGGKADELAPALEVDDTGARLLRVMTINLRHDSDDWRRRFPLIADEIVRLRPDVVGLQEVEIFASQADVLAEMVVERGGPAFWIYDHLKTGWAMFGGEGIGVLSRFPMEEVDFRDIHESRITVRARVRIDDDLALDVYDTHLHHQGGDPVRLAEAKRTTAWIASQDEGNPTVLTGDMNATPSSQTIAHLVASGLVDSFREVHGADTPSLGNTSPISLAEGAFMQNPVRRIDFVFASADLEPIASEVCFRNHDAGGFYPSDHLGVMTTFRVP